VVPASANHGWAWQLSAPPSAFLATRSFGQWAGGNQALRLLREKWAPTLTIETFLLDFPVRSLPIECGLAPLSWRLTKVQRGCIDEGWKVLEKDPHLRWPQ
jgi:hypothetical protein